jgi:hypothetical protein
MKRSPLQRQTILTLALILTGRGLSPALAAPHPGYRPTPVATVATYRRSGKVGGMAFSLAFVDGTVAAPEDVLTSLVMTQHEAPASFWGRSYHPCTLNDAIGALPDMARQFKVATLVYVDGVRISGTAFDVADEHLGPSWNTLSWDGQDIAGALAQLSAGRHTLTVWRHLYYRMPEGDSPTVEGEWHHRVLALAKGELPIVVQP